MGTKHHMGTFTYSDVSGPSSIMCVCKQMDEPIVYAPLDPNTYTPTTPNRSGIWEDLLAEIGIDQNKDEQLRDTCVNLMIAVRKIAKFTVKHHQSIYTGFTNCLQSKGQHMHHIVSGTGSFFELDEGITWQQLIPTIFVITYM